MEGTALLRATGTYASHIPAAGIASKREDGGMAETLRQSEGTATPRHEAKYRHISQHPGQRVRHFGVAEDEVPSGPYGATAPGKNISVREVMEQSPRSQWGTFKREQAERNYDSHQQQPLGHSPLRTEKMATSVEGLGVTVPFGMPLHALELDRSNQGKNTIFPASQPWPSSQDPANPHHDMYIRSHGAYASGEQRRRGYDWSATNIDPNSHVFGSPNMGTSSKQVSSDLKAAFKTPACPRSDNPHQTQHEAMDHYHLGRPRQLPCADRRLPEDFTYGSKPATRGESGNVLAHTAHDGAASSESVDAGLGKSIQEGWKNSSIPDRHADDQVFGIPSVRRDISPPARMSLANTIGYANSQTMDQAMRPRRANQVSDELQQLRTADDIRSLLTENSILLSDAEFLKLFQSAAAIDSSGETCSLATLMQQRRQQALSTLGRR